MSAKFLMEPPQDSMTDKSIGQPPIGTEPIPEQSATLPYVEGAQAMISSDDEQPQPQQETSVVLAKESDAVRVNLQFSTARNFRPLSYRRL